MQEWWFLLKIGCWVLFINTILILGYRHSSKLIIFYQQEVKNVDKFTINSKSGHQARTSKPLLFIFNSPH